MTKWEYCQIRWMERVVNEKEKSAIEEQGVGATFEQITPETYFARLGSVRYFSSQERVTTTNLEATIAQLGLDGWELVSHSDSKQPLELQSFMLKRPIIPEED